MKDRTCGDIPIVPDQIWLSFEWASFAVHSSTRNPCVELLQPFHKVDTGRSIFQHIIQNLNECLHNVHIELVVGGARSQKFVFRSPHFLSIRCTLSFLARLWHGNQTPHGDLVHAEHVLEDNDNKACLCVELFNLSGHKGRDFSRIHSVELLAKQIYRIDWHLVRPSTNGELY